MADDTPLTTNFVIGNIYSHPPIPTEGGWYLDISQIEKEQTAKGIQPESIKIAGFTFERFPDTNGFKMIAPDGTETTVSDPKSEVTTQIWDKMKAIENVVAENPEGTFSDQKLHESLAHIGVPVLAEAGGEHSVSSQVNKLNIDGLKVEKGNGIVTLSRVDLEGNRQEVIKADPTGKLFAQYEQIANSPDRAPERDIANDQFWKDIVHKNKESGKMGQEENGTNLTQSSSDKNDAFVQFLVDGSTPPASNSPASTIADSTPSKNSASSEHKTPSQNELPTTLDGLVKYAVENSKYEIAGAEPPARKSLEDRVAELAHAAIAAGKFGDLGDSNKDLVASLQKTDNALSSPIPMSIEKIMECSTREV